MNPFCVLVTSANDRKDIFDTCFAHSERIWKDCDWPRYVGFGPPFRPGQYGFEKSLISWRSEDWCASVIDHVRALPPTIEYILLMVEDTLFMKPVDNRLLNIIASEMLGCNLSYVRLVPQRRSYIENAIARHGPFLIERIKPGAPYYSSTEMAIWQKDYLLQLLSIAGSDAWSFEHIISDREHWAVIDPIFDQHQIVQKGHWNWDAPRLLKRAGLPPPPPGRPYQTIRARLRGHRENLSFALFGFTGFRVRRWLKSA